MFTFPASRAVKQLRTSTHKHDAGNTTNTPRRANKHQKQHESKATDLRPTALAPGQQRRELSAGRRAPGTGTEERRGVRVEGGDWGRRNKRRQLLLQHGGTRNAGPQLQTGGKRDKD